MEGDAEPSLQTSASPATPVRAGNRARVRFAGDHRAELIATLGVDHQAPVAPPCPGRPARASRAFMRTVPATANSTELRHKAVHPAARGRPSRTLTIPISWDVIRKQDVLAASCRTSRFDHRRAHVLQGGRPEDPQRDGHQADALSHKRQHRPSSRRVAGCAPRPTASRSPCSSSSRGAL